MSTHVKAATSTLSNGHPDGAASTANNHTCVPRRLYSLDEPPSLLDFKQLCSQKTSTSSYPLAASLKSGIPIYDLQHPYPSCSELLSKLQDEWHHILLSGPGVFILRDFLPSPTLLATTNTIFDDIIASESENGGKGDHFASAGTNARIWNSFQKHAERDPASFVQYYSSPYLAAVCDAWLGPAYQITAQVNLVRPGGKPQVAHRDYHLGFQGAESCARYPAAAQVASQFLTLQGAIAHSDMPLDSGPTRFLPFSQQFRQGYMAYRLKEFQDFFDENWVSADLKMGDAVFFNPALFHAAGENQTRDVQRSANLLQISSAFGRTMETVDTLKIIGKCWDEILKLYKQEGEVNAKVRAILNAVAEGYPFPTNLDRRPPAPGGMAPESGVDVLSRGLSQHWDTDTVGAAIEQLRRDCMP